jgi:type IV pilus secretin PilQ/predicted competence protein
LTKEAEAAFKAEQREVEIQQRRKEADLRLSEQERASALARQEFEVKRKQLEELLAPLTEEVFKLKYAHVGVKRIEAPNFFDNNITILEEKGIEEAISPSKKEEGKTASMLSPRGSLTIDQRSNTLIVRDVPEYLSKIKEFIDKIDRPAQAVLIEARLVEMGRSDARSLGVIWGGAWTPRTGTNAPLIDVKGAPPGGPVTGAVGAGTPTTAANFPAALGTLLAGATPFGLGIGWLASNFALDLQIQALEGNRRARVLATPSLMTLDNQPATVSVGRDFPIITFQVTQAGLLQPDIEFKEITTRLAVTPRIVGDGRILLTIAVKDEAQIDQINTTSVIAPVVAKRNTLTQADVADGGTVVIAGLRQERFVNDERGIPWLSKIPVLGWLFKNDLTETERRELVVFLTAKVVPGSGQAAVTPSDLPQAPGVPAPPGPAGQAPTPAPATGAVTAPAEPAAGAPAPPGPSGEAPVAAPKATSEAALAPATLVTARPSPSEPSGGR